MDINSRLDWFTQREALFIWLL